MFLDLSHTFAQFRIRKSQLVAPPVRPPVPPPLEDPPAVELWLAQADVDPVVRPAEPAGERGGRVQARGVIADVTLELLGAGRARVQPAKK